MNNPYDDLRAIVGGGVGGTNGFGTPPRPLTGPEADECAGNCVERALPWVVRCKIHRPHHRVVKAVVYHSYPVGVDLDPWVVPTVAHHYPPALEVVTEYERVEPDAVIE